MIEQLVRDDKDFNYEMFVTKVDNMFIMLLSSIMTDNLDRVKHFLNSAMVEKYETILADLNSKNYRQMYDELNVADTQILSVTDLGDRFQINVSILSRYMDYLVDKKTNTFLSGINDHRVTKTNILTLEKAKNVKDASIAKKCPGCGHNISVNTSGKCEYCGAIFDQAKYDWIITNIETE